MEELLSLKWNNHRSTFLHILSILRDKQLYTDATLACEGRFYSVHRLVLSTCSDYFSAMFDRTTCKNPIIVLKDIKCEDLEALLDYMYLGEVNVRQADLASLIKAAECLRVKGLAVPDDEPPTRRGGRGVATASRGTDGSGGGSPPAKRKRRDDAAAQDGREDVRPSPAVRSNRSPSQSSSRLSPSVGGSDGGDAKVGSPSGGNSLPQRPASADHLSRGNGAPTDSALEGDPTPFVKVEQEDPSADDIGGGGEAFDVHNDSFKEEAKDDHIDELSNDLPEFLQQSGDNSYPPSFAGTSFQPDLQNWQGGDQVLSSNNFSGLGFPSQSQESSPNTSGNDVTTSTTRPAHASSTHSGGLWECSVCGRGFNRHWHLKRHLATHLAVKPYCCPYCPHASNIKANLTLHIRKIHQDKNVFTSLANAFTW